jgi:hypothetical protein
MSDKPIGLPDVTYGGKPPPDWRKAEQDETPDDDEDLAETPPDVVAMLGFDPKDLDETE